MSTDVQAMLEFIEPYQNAKDSAHNLAHIRRILRRLDGLAVGLPAPDPRILHFLACFHGLQPRLRDDTQFRDEAVALLRTHGWDDDAISDAFTSLGRHLTEPRGVEEMIVHDANFLELLGAFGIAKAFTTGGARGQSYEETAAIYEGRYLDQIEFQTPAGRRLAVEGRAYARAFLARLQEEW